MFPTVDLIISLKPFFDRKCFSTRSSKAKLVGKVFNNQGSKYMEIASEWEIRREQCCGSGMFIPDPDFYPSWIPDLGSRIQKQQQKREVKKN
jgi:hypothetical protein